MAHGTILDPLIFVFRINNWLKEIPTEALSSYQVIL